MGTSKIGGTKAASKAKTTTQNARTAAKTTKSTSSTENLIKEIRRNTKRIFNSEQKVIIVMEGIRGELSVSDLCRKYAISTQTYYTWNKEFIEAGKRQLSGDIVRQATSSEVTDLKTENYKLKESLADLVVRYDIVKSGYGHSVKIYPSHGNDQQPKRPKLYVS